MAEEAKANITWEFEKPYYEPQSGWVRHWRAKEHTMAIAKQYHQTLQFIKQLLVEKPGTKIMLVEDRLVFDWGNGEGSMYMDKLDAAVLIPRIEQLTGLELVNGKRKKAA